MRLTIRVTISFLKLIPIPVYYFLANLFFYVIYYILRYRRPLVRKNLNNAFPELSRAETDRIERTFYHYLADTFLETFAFFSMKKNDFAERFDVLNRDLIQTYLSSGKNVLILLGHYGNWEFGCSSPLFIDYPFYTLYKPQSIRFFNDAIMQSREKFGMQLLPYPDLYKKVISLLKKCPVVVLMLADQRPKPEKNARWITFLNQPVTIFRGADNIHQALNGVVLYAKVIKIKRGHYSIEVVPIKDDSYPLANEKSITEKYMKLLEENIRLDPGCYLWSHDRWKFKKPLEKNQI